MKHVYLSLISIILLGMSITVQAQVDDLGNLNDPNTNERANACFQGGSLEGKCNIDIDNDSVVSLAETTWAWECGWYLIRFEYGLLTRENFPAFCSILLPSEANAEDTNALIEHPVLIEPPALPSVGCQKFGAAYVDFGGQHFIEGLITFYSDSNCSILGGNDFADRIVYSPAPFIPLDLCNTGVIEFTSAVIVVIGDDIYNCIL